jgi:hypothetical protein
MHLSHGMGASNVWKTLPKKACDLIADRRQAGLLTLALESSGVVSQKQVGNMVKTG